MMATFALPLLFLLSLLLPTHSPARLVAITFDDVPRQGGTVRCDGSVDVAGLNRDLVHMLVSRHIPATALVTAGNACGPSMRTQLDTVLRVWADAGMEIGNHTWSHFDLNGHDATSWLADADRGAVPLTRFLRARGDSLVWFRYPFLHLGNTPEKKQAVQAGLDRRGWRNAPVTFDNDEWVYAAAYSRAFDHDDAAGMARVADGYVEYMDSTFGYFEQVADDLFRRPVAQVLLVHVSPLNRDHFHRILDRLEGRGYRFVPLATVLQDPAYASPEGYVGTNGTSWLLRWAHTRGVPTPPMPRAETWISGFRRGN